jgi:hypothetical protein
MIQIASKEKQLKVLEDTIQHSKERSEYHDGRKQAHWLELGKALWKIRENKLYEITDHKTFESYCQQRWGFKRSHALQLCHNYEELKGREKSAVADGNSESVPTSELSSRAARALATVPEEQREEVLTEASKNGKPTAKTIKEAAENVTVADVIERDQVGHEIPTPAMPTWERRDEVKDHLYHLSKLRSWAKELQKTSDPFFSEVNLQELYTSFCNAYRNLKQAVPYSICGVCQGQAPKTCTLCHGRGMISKFSYEHHLPELTKSMMRKKAKNDSPTTVSASSR